MEIRGILHVHSTHSYDGKVSLPELKQLLVTEGLQFACMTEHTDELTPEGAAAFVAECRQLSDETFVFVPGFEIPYEDAHILLVGCTEFPGRVAKAAAVLRTATASAALTILAHPVRNRFTLDETMRAVIDGVEIWNQQYEGKWAPRPRSAALLERLRATRPELLATGGVDFHRREHLGAPYTTLTVSTLTEAEILDSLSAGRYVFGSTQVALAARAPWKPTTRLRLASVVAIAVITTGKGVNRVLAAGGLSLPKSWKRLIRRFV